MTKILPVLLIAANALAGVAYLLRGDIKHCLYWSASALIIGTVTF